MTPSTYQPPRQAARLDLASLSQKPASNRKTRETKSPAKSQTPQAPSARFEFRGEALQVYVAGSFNQWQPTPMRKLSSDLWQMDIPMQPGEYQYRFVVDGVWQEDSNNQERVPNGFGQVNSVIRVSPAPAEQTNMAALGETPRIRVARAV